MRNNLININEKTNNQFISELLENNKWPPKDIDEWIEDRSHWYSIENLSRIDKTIKKIHKNTEGKKCLDVGFGNCLVLLRELQIFPYCTGLYISLKNALEKSPPPSFSGKKVDIKFGTQVSTSPPIFLLFVNILKGIKIQYERYLKREIRSNFGFKGVPIVIKFRKK